MKYWSIFVFVGAIEIIFYKGNGTFKSEFHYGKFHRVIPLPARVQNTNVTADYKDGILNLTLPKTEAEKHKVVKVSLGDAG
ncbi:heat shock protein Hsp20 [Calothrix parasitica NIES-267]|uniref:Heat shock protein Hsp20 n=1 Tax=Calothrix parasitica NIES-267 TaxID=1973488 RepID=A0A1Z4LN45_9CYAN|nr:heat shock protein Hsp20 [Calothrix parasitica NIES-267]